MVSIAPHFNFVYVLFGTLFSV